MACVIGLLKVKVCGITSIEDARKCVSAGADMLGFVVDIPIDAPFKLSADDAAAISKVLPAHVEKIIITSATDPARLKGLCGKVGATGIQVAASSKISPSDMLALRALLGNLKVIKSVPITDAASVEAALAYSDAVDILLIENRGVSNQRPDWKLCAQLVNSSKKPVMLAGGLDPANVAQAVAAVKPWGVDVMSGVETGGRKDATKLGAFISASRQF